MKIQAPGSRDVAHQRPQQWLLGTVTDQVWQGRRAISGALVMPALCLAHTAFGKYLLTKIRWNGNRLPKVPKGWTLVYEGRIVLYWKKGERNTTLNPMSLTLAMWSQRKSSGSFRVPVLNHPPWNREGLPHIIGILVLHQRIPSTTLEQKLYLNTAYHRSPQIPFDSEEISFRVPTGLACGFWPLTCW